MEKFRLRNWRALLAEVGIIVLGVGIALAAQQAVETWREHRRYDEARAAIRAELEVNFASLRRRGEYSACMSRRLDAVGALLDKAETREAFTAANWIGAAQSRRLVFSAEAEVGKSDLFSTDEARDYSRLYSFMHTVEEEQDRERQAWGRLRMLEGRARLTPEVIAMLQTTLADARFEYQRVEYISRTAFAEGERIGLGHDPQAAQLVKTFQTSRWAHCVPMNTPTAEAERLVSGRFLDPKGKL